jgi:DnaJ-domain-containing protein 1
MKYRKIVDDLYSQLDSAAREQHKREEKLKTFLKQFTTEDQKLRKRLGEAINDNERSKLMNELDLVRSGRELLEPYIRLRHA